MGGKVFKKAKVKKEKVSRKTSGKGIEGEEALKDGEEKLSWSERMDKLRKIYPKAYMPWSDEDDEVLVVQFQLGKTIPEISKIMGRQTTSIRARLEKHEMIEKEK